MKEIQREKNLEEARDRVACSYKGMYSDTSAIE